MAEIHVERKRGVGTWVWVLLLVLLIVAAVGYLWYAGYITLPGFAGDPSSVLIGAGGPHGA